MPAWPWQISKGNEANAQLKENISKVLSHASRHQIDSLKVARFLLQPRSTWYSHLKQIPLICRAGCLLRAAKCGG